MILFTKIKINTLFTSKSEVKYILFIGTLISFLLALALKLNIIFHTDTIAPIQQIKLLVNSKYVTL